MPTILSLGLSLVAVACGGGGNGVVNPGWTASFVADPVDAGPGTVSMAEHDVTGDVVTIRIAATAISGLYGAAFDVDYDPSVTRFESWDAGDLLEQDGSAPNYTVVAVKPGTIVIGASRTGNVPGVEAGGRTLMRLTFRMLRAGTAPVSFRFESMTDDRLPPQEIPNIQWFGGSLVAI